MYFLIRRLLFFFSTESAHYIGLSILKLSHYCGLTLLLRPKINPKPCAFFGLNFKHPVGLAAGFDKNGDYIESLFALGFSFVEVGTLTPKPQSGNPKPRLFRLEKDQALINRMGFNNKGIDYLVQKVLHLRQKGPLGGILGINIGKNAKTPIEKAHEDYLICYEKAYPVADYITINISSPNTKDLRQLQSQDQLEKLLSTLTTARMTLSTKHNKCVPLLVKIAPDINKDEISIIAKLLISQKVDGVIATNTTISRETLQDSRASETGGLSGRPLFSRSLGVVQHLTRELEGKVPIIGVGGIMNAKDATIMLESGASMLQLYTGFIYEGPGLLRQIVND